jgi:hypothetical protein
LLGPAFGIPDSPGAPDEHRTAHGRQDSRAAGSPQTIVLAPRIDTGRGRLLGRSGDVNIQVGDRNRNKQ